jgi:Fe-S cluster biosynthesis and repair protein YggX
VDIDERIKQFEALANEDPSDDMTWFSLGNAYAEKGRHQDAATAFERSLAVNTDLSRAYQLAAEQYLALDDKDRARPLLTEGFHIAARNGDMKVKDAIIAHFNAIGEEPPQDQTVDPEDVPEGSFVCRRTKRLGTQMERPPFKGPLGQWIKDNIAQETWRDWIAQGTKVINELRLDLSNDEDAQTYDKYMRDYLGITDEVLANEINSPAQS